MHFIFAVLIIYDKNIVIVFLCYNYLKRKRKRKGNLNMRKGIKILATLGALSIGGVAMAADVAALTEGWAASLNGVKGVLVIGATIVGLAMMAAGGIQLKKHGENPQQVPLNRPLIFLAAGALLFGLGATSNTVQQTIFGTDSGASRDTTANLEDDFTVPSL